MDGQLGEIIEKLTTTMTPRKCSNYKTIINHVFRTKIGNQVHEIQKLFGGFLNLH